MATRFRWTTIALIVALIVINFLGRSALSVAVKPPQREFGITTAQHDLVSSAFAIG